MNSTKTYFGILVGLVVVCGAGFFLWKELATPNTPVNVTEETTGTVCTMDAQECPDGSWVGRSGSRCEFVCPIATTTDQLLNTVLLLETRIGATSTAASVSIAPLALQDSRCPIDVKCIQAGTVKVRTNLTAGSGTAAQEFALNKPIITGGFTITLVSVGPEKESKKTILGKDYRFVFKIEKRK